MYTRKNQFEVGVHPTRPVSVQTHRVASLKVESNGTTNVLLKQPIVHEVFVYVATVTKISLFGVSHGWQAPEGSQSRPQQLSHPLFPGVNRTPLANANTGGNKQHTHNHQGIAQHSAAVIYQPQPLCVHFTHLPASTLPNGE